MVFIQCYEYNLKHCDVFSAKPVSMPKVEATPQLSLKYDTPTAVPSARKTVTPAKVGQVAVRNLDDKKSEAQSVIDGVFKQMQTDFQKVCPFMELYFLYSLIR
jgi:hypothetical protein